MSITTDDITSGILHWNSAHDHLFNDRRSILPLWFHIWAPANYAPRFRLHLHSMAQHGYQHIVSTALYLSNFDGRTTKYTLETF